MNFLRGLKHFGFLINKAVSKSETLLALKDGLFRASAKLRPFKFRRTRYLESWLRFTVEPESTPLPIPLKLYCIWAGTNPMSPNRKRSIQAIREKNKGLEVEMVTPDNLKNYVLPEHPLHPAYEFLSLVHKSDYLRAYLMHYYGGGYCDIKVPKCSWTDIIIAMNNSENIWVQGFQELSSRMCAQIDGQMGKHVRRHFCEIVGTSGFLVRPQTALTREWLSEVERRLSYYQNLLNDNPGNERGDNPGYPVPWTALLGQIFQPLQLKYLDHVKIDNRLLLSFENYK